MREVVAGVSSGRRVGGEETDRGGGRAREIAGDTGSWLIPSGPSALISPFPRQVTPSHWPMVHTRENDSIFILANPF